MNTCTRLSLLALILIGSACNNGGSSGGGALPLPVAPPGPSITGPVSPLPAAVVGTPITPITFTATGAAPISFFLGGGAPAPGLTLDPSGVLSGTPLDAGIFTFTLTVTDVNGTDSEPFSQLVSIPTTTESEPNDTSGTADPLPFDTYAAGAITADDVDFWSFDATAGQVIRLEMFAVRRDHDAWESNGNRPRLNLIGPNGTDLLIGHDYDNAGTVGWQFGDHDLDIPMFMIPADGIYYARVSPYVAATNGGSYAVRVTDLQPGIPQEETEGNDVIADANPINPGLVRATWEDDGSDFFSFEITEPTLIYFEVTAYRNGVFGTDDDYVDLSLELMADEFTTLATNYRVFFHDPALNYHFVTPGTYFLHVFESADGTDGDGDYFITYTATPVGLIIEAEPNDEALTATPIAYGDVVRGFMSGEADFYEFQGTAGDMIRVNWFEGGASQENFEFYTLALMLNDTDQVMRRISFTGTVSLANMRALLPETGTYYIRFTMDSGPGSYTFQLQRIMESGYESEGNDTIGAADTVPDSGRISGALDPGSDVDVYGFPASGGEVVTFSIYASGGGSSNGFASHSGYTTNAFPVLPDLEVVDGAGVVVEAMPYMGTTLSGESITNGLATCEVTFVAPSSGTFYIRVTSSDGNGDENYRYLLERR